MFITNNGGNGNQGQAGADGKNGEDRLDAKPSRTFAQCKANGCRTVWGLQGDKGNSGKDGGNAGTSGDGGEAGKQRLHVNQIVGSIKLKTCPGQGGTAPINGKGGKGGLGSLGGKGFKCAMRESCSPNLFDPMNPSCHTSCRNDGATGRASRGARGDNGKDGTTPTDPGTDGQIDDSYLRTSRLSENARSKYPLALLKLMKRYAEDRIWANDIEEGKSVLRFLITLMEGRKGIQAMKKDAERRLGFLDKEGFDRFGNNKLFAPLMKWERLKENAEDIEKYAKEYQDAFNRIQRSIRQQEDITDILKDLAPKAARIQVSNQIKRLKTARAVDESEKRLYVESIAQVENRMSSTLETLKATLVELQAQKNMEHFFAILQGVTGFVGALIEKDPGAALGSAFSLIENEALRCNRGTLQQNKAKLEKWVRFGKAYKALADPSDLNFDEMDIQSVPEIMEADLEINKEALLADLVCLLDVDLPPQD
ncbi:uncharacterized protein [Pocillopora verrucosa]|uniref:uncharacterized protein n=1 Tax=Pocillopora verrucosa TaxID=203993 RepID=UPI0033423B0E